MKKVLLSAMMLLAAITGFAQQTIDTAPELESGLNSYTFPEGEGSSPYTAYWKYTATENSIVYVSSDKNVQSVYEDDENTTVTGGSSYTDGKTIWYYPAREGHTLYFKVADWNGNTPNITLENVVPNEFVGKGLSADDPIEIMTDGSEQIFFGTKSGYSLNSYARYTATENGLLIITVNGYISCTVNGGNTINSESASGVYLLKIAVEAGNTYDIVFTHYNPFVATSELTHPQGGSLDMPFALEKGENTVPAAIGDYYYTYTFTEEGIASITSDNYLPAGQVKVYSSKPSNYSSPVKTSESGSYNVTFEPYLNSTYYICVSRGTEADNDETFTFNIEAYKAGDKESNPIVISEIPSTGNVTSYANGTTYFKVTVPAGTESQYLQIKATSDVASPSTKVYLYPANAGIYYGVSGNKVVKTIVGDNTSDSEYTIRWDAYEENPVTFDVEFVQIAQGDEITNPLEAVKGENIISGDGTKYYKYTTTIDGKLVITSTPGMTVSFPRGTGKYDGTYNAIVSGVKYSIETTKDTEYYIQLTNATNGDSFILEEAELEVGETRNNPLPVEGNEYVLGSETASNLWLKYTVENDGILVIESDLEYNPSTGDMIYYDKESEQYTSSLISQDENYNSCYKAVIPVFAGDVYLVNLKLSTSYEGYKISFTERDAEPGESASNPIIIHKDSVVTVPQISRSMPQWYKVFLRPGESKLTFSNWITVDWYLSEENVKAGIQEDNYVTASSDYTHYYFTPEVNEENAGWQYFAIYGNYSELEMTFSGDGVVAQGDSIAWTLEAVPGDNVIKGNDTRYYNYTTTVDGYLTIRSAYDISIYTATGQYYTLYGGIDDEGLINNRAEVTKGTDIIIELQKATDGDIFTLGESEYEQGELRENPIVVENGEYTIDSQAKKNLWLQYTAEKDGYLTIEWNTPFDPDYTFSYGQTDAAELTSLGLPRRAQMWLGDANFEPESKFGYWETIVTDMGNGRCRVDDLMNTGMELYINPEATYAGANEVTLSSPWWEYYNIEEDYYYPGCYYYFCNIWDENANNGEGSYVYYPFYPNGTDAETWVEQLVLYTGDNYAGYYYDPTDRYDETATTNKSYYYINCATLKLNDEDEADYFTKYLFFKHLRDGETVEGSSSELELPNVSENDVYKTTVPVSAGDVYLVNIFTTLTQKGDTKVTFTEGVPDAISAVNSDATFKVGKGMIKVNGDANVKIYNLAGTKIAESNAHGNTTFNLATGIYLVNINGTTSKVTVK